MLSLNSRTSILKEEVLAISQLTLTTLNQFLLKSNLQLSYKLLFFSFLLFAQLQLLIQIFYTEIFFQLFLVTQLLQNTSLQIANGLWISTVFSVLIMEFMYHLLVIFIYMFSSIIMITSLLDTIVRTKHWNQFVMNISSPASILMYNNSASPVLLIYNLSYNITSLTDFSNNFLFSNNHEIPFLQTSLKNSYHPPNLTLFQLQSTNLLSR